MPKGTVNEPERHTSARTTTSGGCLTETCPGGTRVVEQMPRDKPTQQEDKLELHVREVSIYG